MLARLKSISILDLLRSRRLHVAGHSMEPLIRENDRLLATRRGQPQRGDVVAYHEPLSHEISVKRVCGLPNERIELMNGALYVDGEPLPETYVFRASSRPQAGELSRWTTGYDEFVLLGDNRGDSLDSRAYGPIHRSAIIGRVWYRYGPADRSGRIPR